MERFNFDKSVKLHKCCATDDVRNPMHNVHFENGYAYASDDHVMVKAKIEDISDLNEYMIAKLEGKNLHRKRFEKLLSYDCITEITDEEIVAVDEHSEIRLKFNNDVKMPNFQKLLDDQFHHKKTPVTRIKMNTDCMKCLFDVFPEGKRHGIIFEFNDESSAVLVKYERGQYIDVTAIIMPMMIND